MWTSVSPWSAAVAFALVPAAGQDIIRRGVVRLLTTAGPASSSGTGVRPARYCSPHNKTLL